MSADLLYASCDNGPSRLPRRPVPFAADRDFALPSAFVERVVQAGRALDVERLHWHMGQGDVDHSWSEIETLLCRSAPDVFAEMMRRFARTARMRQATALRQLSWSVADIADLMTADEVIVLVEAWHRVVSSPDDSSESGFIETNLSKSILLHRESAVAQWEWLLHRPADSGELVAMADDFKALSPEDQGRHLAVDLSDTRALRLALWFLSVQPALHADTARRLVAAALAGADSGARGLAFLILQRLTRTDWPALAAIDLSTRVARLWAVERYYGTLALMRVERPSASALSRCHLADVPAGLLTLQGEERDGWAQLFCAALLEALERRIGSAGATESHPGIDLEMEVARRPWQRVSLTLPESQSVTHVAELSIWGGLQAGVRSRSPHGVSLGIMMSASLDVDAMRQIAREIDAPANLWPSELMRLAERYHARGVDLRHWLLRAVEAGDPVDRVSAMKLALLIEDHRAADILAQVRADVSRPPEQRSRAWRVRLQGESNSRSPWAKELDSHLFGRRQHKHAADPWLP